MTIIKKGDWVCIKGARHFSEQIINMFVGDIATKANNQTFLKVFWYKEDRTLTYAYFEDFLVELSEAGDK